MQIDNAAIARQLGYSKEEMIAKFGNPGEKTPTEIGNILGLDNATVTSIFGTPQTEDTSSSFAGLDLNSVLNTSDDDTSSNAASNNDATDSFTKTQDDKYEEVAQALGYDTLSVSAVMKAIANGVSGKPEEIVPKLAYDLGLPQTFVSNVLRYLNNGQI